MVSFLIQQGAIEAQQYATDRMDAIFKMENLYRNKNILDLLIRGVTLCDSLHNSSQRSWNDQDEAEDHSYFELRELCNSLFGDEKGEEKEPPVEEPQGEREQKLRELLQSNRSKGTHHKVPHYTHLQYFRNYSKPKGGQIGQQEIFSPNMVSSLSNFIPTSRTTTTRITLRLYRRTYAPGYSAVSTST